MPHLREGSRCPNCKLPEMIYQPVAAPDGEWACRGCGWTFGDRVRREESLPKWAQQRLEQLRFVISNLEARIDRQALASTITERGRDWVSLQMPSIGEDPSYSDGDARLGLWLIFKDDPHKLCTITRHSIVLVGRARTEEEKDALWRRQEDPEPSRLQRGMSWLEAKTIVAAMQEEPEVVESDDALEPWQTAGRYEYQLTSVRDASGYVVIAFGPDGEPDGVYLDPSSVHLAARRKEHREAIENAPKTTPEGKESQ